MNACDFVVVKCKIDGMVDFWCQFQQVVFFPKMLFIDLYTTGDCVPKVLCFLTGFNSEFY